VTLIQRVQLLACPVKQHIKTHINQASKIIKYFNS